MIESSKDFAKEIMFKYDIPTAKYKTFSINQRDEAHRYIDGHTLPVVLKADGLAAGKGVIISHHHGDAHRALDSMFEGMFGTAGDHVVIEEFLYGEEASVFAITDGSDFISLVPSQDHKRAFDGDKGPNTGGMGAYAPAKIVNKDIMHKVEEKIIKPLINGLASEGIIYRGCIYCGLMIEDNEPSVVEFNCRFGDPETQVVLPLIEGDLTKLLYSAATGGLLKDSINIKKDKAACCVVIASDGYPNQYEKGNIISGIDKANTKDTYVYHAGTKEVNGNIVNNGGRVLGVTAVSDNLEEAVKESYAAINKIEMKNKFYRKDIAQKGLQ
jgi:phosphoribosylamine--glycine ligase